MRDIKDFQARYDRWKNGERYWDIRGVDLPQYDTGDKNTVVTNDGSIFNVDPSAINARNLEVTTPDIVVNADYPKIENKIHGIYDNIANLSSDAAQYVINKVFNIPIKAYAASNKILYDIFGDDTGEHKIHTWRDTPDRYIDTGYGRLQVNPITGRFGKFPDGEENKNFKRSVLGDIGLTSNSDGTWRYYDKYGNLIKQCAKFANMYSQAVGRPTAGDAWTTKGIFGDSVLYNKQLFGLPDSIAQDLQNGDIVDLRWDNSKYASKSKKYGRGNSHTGRIFKPNNTDTYVIHNTSGKIKIEPLTKFDKYWSPYFYLTQIRRPFLKNKTNYEKEK